MDDCKLVRKDEEEEAKKIKLHQDYAKSSINVMIKAESVCKVTHNI